MRQRSDEVIPGRAALSVGDPGDTPPEGWKRVLLTDIARLESGHTPSRKHPEYWDGNVPWLGIRDAGRHHGQVIHRTLQTITEEGLANSAARWLPAGTVCLSRTASVGYVTILGRPMATSQDFVNWVCSDALEPKFLMYALMAEGEHLHEFGKGSTHTTIYFPAVLAFHLNLPPLSEQRRIVAQVEGLLVQVSAARERLERVRGILKRFRQAVLAAACSGKLTEDWRGLGPAETTTGRELEHLPRRRKPATLATDEFALEAPECWKRVSLDALAVHMTSGSRAWKPFYKEGGYGTFVMAQNVRPMLFDRSYRQGVAPPESDPERERTRVEKDDVLVTIVGANTGDVCRVDTAVKDHFVCQSVALVRLARPEMAPYVELWLNSPEHGQRQYRTWAYGEGRPHLSFDHLRSTLVCLPSLAEQTEILRRVHAIFEFADELEKRLHRATVQAERLAGAILSKAFRGELVPTEAELAHAGSHDYEAAWALLERVRARRTGSENECAPEQKRSGPTASKGRRRADVRAGLAGRVMGAFCRAVCVQPPASRAAPRAHPPEAFPFGRGRLGPATGCAPAADTWRQSPDTGH